MLDGACQNQNTKGHTILEREGPITLILNFDLQFQPQTLNQALLSGPAGAPPSLISGLISLLGRTTSLNPPSLASLLSLLHLTHLRVFLLVFNCLNIGKKLNTKPVLLYLQGVVADAYVANSLAALIRSNPGKQVIATLVVIVLWARKKQRKRKRRKRRERRRRGRVEVMRMTVGCR